MAMAQGLQATCEMFHGTHVEIGESRAGAQSDFGGHQPTAMVAGKAEPQCMGSWVGRAWRSLHGGAGAARMRKGKTEAHSLRKPKHRAIWGW